MIPLTARLHFHLLSSCEERKRKQKVASVREREAKENLSTLYLGRRHSFKKKNGDKAQGSLSHSFKREEKRKKGDGSWGRHSDRRAPGGTGSARCVRRLDGSLVPAIRITYRVSLRSSSSREPRYPSTGVVSGFLVSLFFFFCYTVHFFFLLAKKKKVRYNKSLKHSFVSSEVKKDHKREKECVLSGVDKGWTPSLKERGGLPHFTSGSREVDSQKSTPARFFDKFKRQ